METRQNRYTAVQGRCSIIIFIVTIVLTILIVIAGVCVSILLDRFTANIILCVLIGVLLIVGLLSFLIIRRANNRALQRREEAALQQRNLRRTDRVNPSAPPMSTRTSWALKKPWRDSDRSTIPINNSHNNNQYA